MKKFFLAILLFLVIAIPVMAEECPFGLKNDAYPGQCGRYIDKNKDGYCDYSENENEVVSSTNEEIKKSPYNFLAITFITIGVYIISWLLAKNKKITVIQHRKFWNILLLASFIITAITSVVYLLRLEFGIEIGEIKDLSFWHIEIGYFMILVSIFHSLWHIPYFKTIFYARK